MPKVLANGVTLSYQQTGNGSDLVMIHGLAASRAFWYPLIAQQLEQKFRVTFYDLRGHGYSETPPSGYTSQDMASDLHELLNHLQIHQALFVGHSFGGVVALQYALQHPERVSSLVVADSRISCLQPVQRLKDTDYLSELEAAILAASPDIDWENETQIGLRFLEEIAKERWQSLRRDSRYGYIPFGGSGGGTRAAQKWLNLLNTTTARQDLQNTAGLSIEKIRHLSVPLVAVYGARSRCLPTCQALTQILPTCQTHLIPDSSHFYPVTQAATFARILTHPEVQPL
ncbi:MAG: alpha/beta hydrolase [Desertifilum sp.]|nr:alpha/beta hydrolase [Desertifilum sp.]